MIKTPRKNEYPEIFKEAIRQTQTAQQLDPIISELKSLYASKGNVEDVYDFTITSSSNGYKVNLTDSNKNFPELKSVIINAMNEQIYQKEREIGILLGMIPSDVAIEEKQV